MAGPDGTVSLDVVPNTAAASAEIQRWGAGLKPVELQVAVDPLAPAVTQDVAKAQKSLDTLNTSKAQAQLAQLEQRGQQLAKQPFGSSLAPTGGGFLGAPSKQSTTFTNAGSEIAAAAPVAATQAIEDEAAATEKAVAASTRFGGSLRTVGQNAGQLANNIGPLVGDVGGLGQALSAVGSSGGGALAAITVAAIGFKSAWSQLQDQTDKGIELFTKDFDPTKFQAAFDPTNPNRFFTEMVGIQRTLEGIDKVGPLDAKDSLLHLDQTGKVSAAGLEKYKALLDSVSTDQARQSLDFLADSLRKLESEGKVAEGTTDELYSHLGDREAADRAVAGIEAASTAVDKFGFVLDSTKGRLAQYAASLGSAFAPITAANAADDAVTAGQDRIAKARKNLTDIESGSSDALTAARQDLVDADKGLTKAVEANAKQQQDAFDKLRDAQDRLDAAREKGAAQAAGGEAVPGTIDRSVSRDIGSAERDVEKAKRDLADAQRGSDGITSAKERQAAAQKKVNDEEAKVGPNSQAATDAQKELNDAEDAMVPLLVAQKVAAAEVGDELDKHPQAIQQSIDQVKEWQRQGLISVDVADRWLAKLEQLKADSAQLNGPAGLPSAKDNSDAEHRAQRPLAPPDPPAPAGPTTHTITGDDVREFGPQASRYGLPAVGNPRDGTEVHDKFGHTWKYNQRADKWTSQFHEGGLVGADGGEVHDGEIVFSKWAVAKWGAQNLLAMNSRQASFAAPSPAVAPAATTFAPGDLTAALQAVAAQLATMNARPASVVAHVTAHGIGETSAYADMSRALADAGFKK